MFAQGDDARYYRLREAPRFHAWSEERRDQGEKEELLDQMEDLSFWMRPSDLAELSAKDFERMLVDLKHEYRDD